jgi:PAS domain S-box-containing protein
MGAVAGKEYRIYILEHLPNDADQIEIQLRKGGFAYTSRRISTKEMFTASLAEHVPDLIIASNAIPRFDTLSALTQSRQNHPDLPWIIVSGTVNENLAVSFMKTGAVDYINKRTLTRLGLAAKQALERSSVSREEPDRPPEAEAPPEAVQPDEGELPPGLLETVVRTAEDLIAVIQVDGKRLYNNPAYERILDDPETLQGTDSFLDVHPDDREAVKRVFHESLRTGTGKRIEYRLLDKDGNFRGIESQGTVFRLDEGRSTFLSVISRDITHRVKAETALQNLVAGTSTVTGNEFYTALVRHLATTLEVRYVLVAESVGVGHERARVLAYWADGEWVQPFEYDTAQTPCQQVLQGGRLVYFPDHVRELFANHAVLRASRAVCYLGLPLFHSSGQLIGHAFLMDERPLENFARAKHILTLFAARAAMELERKKSIQDLRRSQSVYRSILESLNDGVIMTDLQDVITYANRRMVEISGYKLMEMIGKQASSLLLPREEWEHLHQRNADRKQGVAERYRTRLTRKDGSPIDALLSAGPYRDVDGNIVGTLAVVTAVDPVSS